MTLLISPREHSIRDVRYKLTLTLLKDPTFKSSRARPVEDVPR